MKNRVIASCLRFTSSQHLTSSHHTMTPSPETNFPPLTSPHLILAHPTTSERHATWSQSHSLWGRALAKETYLHREVYAQTLPVAKSGGITHWILTDSRDAPDQRHVYSSCETIRKRGLIALSGGEVRDVYGHVVGAVFTDPEFRGRGYARKMLSLLGPRLAFHFSASGLGVFPGAMLGNHESSSDSPALSPSLSSNEQPVANFSVLYSDIGKKFYANLGWEPFPSTHLSFPPLAPTPRWWWLRWWKTNGSEDPAAQTIGYHELAELCAIDETLLRAHMARLASSPKGPHTEPDSDSEIVDNTHDSKKKNTFVALLPDLDAMLWHLMREDFIMKNIFGRTPTVRGAVAHVLPLPGTKCKPNHSGLRVTPRVWAIWTRAYADAGRPTALHILRFVVEDRDAPESVLVPAVRAVLRTAQAEAASCLAPHVELWNPDPLVRRLVDRANVTHDVVVRDTSSIPCLMWYGEGSVDTVDWVCNEKYGWW